MSPNTSRTSARDFFWEKTGKLLDSSFLHIVRNQLNSLTEAVNEIIRLEPESANFLPDMTTVERIYRERILQKDRPTDVDWIMAV